MELRAARPSERDEVLDLLARWFGDRAFFALYNQHDPKFRDDLCLIARDRGELVSTVQIFDRPINLAGQSVPMGGIGSVFTREDYRHKGVASELMKLSVETMRREGFELSLLFAERLTFYNQFGWREIGRQFSVLAGTEAIAGAPDFAIDVFQPTRDFEAVAAIHRSYSGRFDLTAVRDRADWEASLVYAGNQPNEPGTGSVEHFVLARGGGRVRAYARATRFHGIAMIMEYGYADGAEPAMLALFKYCGEAASGARSTLSLLGGDRHRGAEILRVGQNSGVIVTHTAHDSALEEFLAAAGAPVMHHADNNYMWRVIAPERLASRLGVAASEAQARALEIFASPNSLFWTADRF
ncbi:MAG TPA: GNAT family N-acetyltransferase [Candidatus Binataceae bacterium]|nr:GNAT family N-acetyltransferase [Candidatus Binataceae bacterium]